MVLVYRKYGSISHAEANLLQELFSALFSCSLPQARPGILQEIKARTNLLADSECRLLLAREIENVNMRHGC